MKRQLTTSMANQAGVFVALTAVTGEVLTVREIRQHGDGIEQALTAGCESCWGIIAQCRVEGAAGRCGWQHARVGAGISSDANTRATTANLAPERKARTCCTDFTWCRGKTLSEGSTINRK